MASNWRFSLSCAGRLHHLCAPPACSYDDVVDFMDPITKLSNLKGFLFNISMLKKVQMGVLGAGLRCL